MLMCHRYNHQRQGSIVVVKDICEYFTEESMRSREVKRDSYILLVGAFRSQPIH